MGGRKSLISSGLFYFDIYLFKYGRAADLKRSGKFGDLIRLKRDSQKNGVSFRAKAFFLLLDIRGVGGILPFARSSEAGIKNK
jgi:hypothetical protein